MAVLVLFGSEFEALRTLDEVSYEDEEAGGDGWVGIREVAGVAGWSYAWASQLLAVLFRRGAVERRRLAARYVYAVSEVGGAVLFDADRESAPNG